MMEPKQLQRLVTELVHSATVGAVEDPDGIRVTVDWDGLGTAAFLVRHVDLAQPGLRGYLVDRLRGIITNRACDKWLK